MPTPLSPTDSLPLDPSAPARRPRYLEGLNPEQRDAVEAVEGPVLVLAGAGVGKTRVLTTRIAHLVATFRARGYEILAVTFTNKAAREMRGRIETLTGMYDGFPWMGTFHSIGAKILRRHAELVALKPNFTILDTDDQIRLLKQILKAENIDDKRWPARALAGEIDAWKNRGLDPAHVSASEAAAFANGKGGALYKTYQDRLKTLNAVDFGDLLLESLRLFREHPDVLEQYQRRLRYILVDEYQDTNVVQYLWLRLIAQAHRNVCCVGDDDQSIYGWRGAEVDNILRFERDFPGAKVIRLERNYRSTGHILAVASGLIAHNYNRLGKTLFTDAELGEAPVVAGVWDSAEEARAIGDEIEAAERKGVSLAEIAILVRASFQMRQFEERFLEIGVPYRVLGGPRFYERAEIRDALAYFRVAFQPDDDLAFERIVNLPRRGFGESTLALMHAHGRAKNVSLTRAARELIESEELKPKPRQTLRSLLADFDRWSATIDKLSPEEFAQTVLEESGLVAMWKAENTEEAKGRLENLKELARSMGDFPSLEAFLEHVSLVVDAETRRGRSARLDHDAPRRQGAGVRDGVPSRLGGGPVSPPARARRERPGRARGRAPARLRRAHPRAPPRLHLSRGESAGARLMADIAALPLHRRAARGSRRFPQLGASRAVGRAGVALRPSRFRGLELCDAGLAAGARARGRGAEAAGGKCHRGSGDSPGAAGLAL